MQDVSETELRIVDPLPPHARSPLLLFKLQPARAAGFHGVAALDRPVDPQVVAGGAEARPERGDVIVRARRLALGPPIRRRAVEFIGVKRGGRQERRMAIGVNERDG